MRPLVLSLTALLLTVAMTCCSGSPDYAPVDIARFDRDVRSYTSLDPAARDSFRHVYRDVINNIRALTPLPPTTDPDTLLEAYAQSRGVEVFGPEIDTHITSLDNAHRLLGQARHRLAAIDSTISWPHIYGVISTYNQAVVTADTTVLVGLNHFLGSDYEGYCYFEPYMRRQKVPEMIVPTTVEAIIAANHPYRPAPAANATTRMVYDGALTLAAATLIADTPAEQDSVIMQMLGWTPEQWQSVKQNEAAAWHEMINRDLIYSSDPVVAQRLTAPAPSTSIVSADAPGRLGTYFGIAIARSWLKRNSAGNPLVLLDSARYNSPSILVEARYTPSM